MTVRQFTSNFGKKSGAKCQVVLMGVGFCWQQVGVFKRAVLVECSSSKDAALLPNFFGDSDTGEWVWIAYQHHAEPGAVITPHYLLLNILTSHDNLPLLFWVSENSTASSSMRRRDRPAHYLWQHRKVHNLVSSTVPSCTLRHRLSSDLYKGFMLFYIFVEIFLACCMCCICVTCVARYFFNNFWSPSDWRSGFSKLRSCKSSELPVCGAYCDSRGFRGESTDCSNCSFLLGQDAQILRANSEPQSTIKHLRIFIYLHASICFLCLIYLDMFWYIFHHLPIPSLVKQHTGCALCFEVQIHAVGILWIRLAEAIALEAQIPPQAHHEVLNAIVAASPVPTIWDSAKFRCKNIIKHMQHIPNICKLP